MGLESIRPSGGRVDARAELSPAGHRRPCNIALAIDADDPAMAERFLRRAQETAASLQRLPLRIPLYAPAADARPEGVREIAIRSFPKHLLFFRVEDDRVRVIRVLHGARDPSPLLRMEVGQEGGS